MNSQAIPKGYLVANYTVHDQAIYDKYVVAARVLNTRFDLNPIVYDSNVEVKEGKTGFVIAIAEFPDFAAAERFYNSPEYQEILPYRLASTTGTVVLVKGLIVEQK